MNRVPPIPIVFVDIIIIDCCNSISLQIYKMPEKIAGITAMENKAFAIGVVLMAGVAR